MAALFFLLLVSCISSIASLNHSLHIIVVSPSKAHDGVPLWMQGEDNLLQTVDNAVSDINNSPDLLIDYEIESILIDVPRSDPNKGVVEFVRVLSEGYNKSNNIVGVVGLFDNILANTILPVVDHEGIELIQLIDSTALHLDNDKQYRHLYTVLPTLELETRASLSLLLALNWTKIGLIYNSSFHDRLYTRAVEGFLVHSKKIDRPISVRLIDIQQNKTIDKTSSDERIFLTLLPPQSLAVFLCTVYQEGLLWPEYAWITFGDEELNDIIATYTCASKHTLIEAIENIVIVNSSRTTSQFDPDCNETIDQGIPHTSSLYDSILALSLGLNTSADALHELNLSLAEYGPGKPMITNIIQQQLANLSFCGRNGRVRIGAYPSGENNSLQIVQIQSANYEEVGIYDTQSQELNLNVSRLGKVPTAFPIYNVYDIFPQPLTVTLSVTTVICFLFTTVVLILFIRYKNEPEVKATSVWLSLCMFVGCYFLLMGALVHFIDSGVVTTSETWKLANCNVGIFSTSVGIDLVLATLLFKVLRVWRIFSVGTKTGKAWTDRGMLLVIGLIISVKVFLLIIWLAADTYTLTDVVVSTHETSFGFSNKIVQQCESRMQAVWLVIIYGYSGLLALALIAVSIKTRKIKRGNFKDTKKISTLIAILIYVTIVIGALWGVLRVSGNSTASKVTLGLAYCVVPLLCEMFLFFPKLIPPIQRQLRSGRPTSTQVTHSFTNPVFKNPIFSTQNTTALSK